MDTARAEPDRSPDRSLTRAHLALCGVQLVFGLFPVSARIAFGEGGFTPLGVGAWRMGFGALALCALAVLFHRRAFFAAWRDLPSLAVASFLGVSANMLLYLEGLSRSSANEATLVMCLIPVFTFALAALSGQERFSAVRGAGVIVALIGATALLWAENAGIARAHLAGNALMALNALSFSAYFVWSRRLVARHPALVVAAWNFALALPFAAWAAWRGGLLPAEPARDPLFVVTPWLALAWILVFPTVLTYVLNMFALARLRASTTAVYIYAQPPVTLVAAWWLLGETPTRGLIVGAVLIFAGIWMVARRPPPPQDVASLDGHTARP